MTDNDKNFCKILNCQQSNQTCCKHTTITHISPNLYCCDADTQQTLQSDLRVVERAMIISFAALIFLMCSVSLVKRWIKIRKIGAKKAAEQAAKNPPPFNIALTMELNSKPVLPGYCDVIKGKSTLTSVKTETNEKPLPPFENV